MTENENSCNFDLLHFLSRSSAGAQYAPRNRASFDVRGICAGRASTRERVPGSGGGARAKQRVERVARCEERALFVKAWARAGRLRRSRAARRTGSSGYDLRSPLDPRGRFPSRGGGRAPAPSPPNEKTRSPSTRGSRGGASGTRGARPSPSPLPRALVIPAPLRLVHLEVRDRPRAFLRESLEKRSCIAARAELESLAMCKVCARGPRDEGTTRPPSTRSSRTCDI